MFEFTDGQEVSACPEGVGSYVTITHDALDLTVQEPLRPLLLRHGPLGHPLVLAPIPSPASDIWCSRPETFSNGLLEECPWT